MSSAWPAWVAMCALRTDTCSRASVWPRVDSSPARSAARTSSTVAVCDAPVTSIARVIPEGPPPNGCLFLNGAGDVVFLYRLSTKAELPTGIESLKNGAQSAMGAPATGISIRGFPGFVVTGQGTGTLETQMAVQVGDYVLESSVPKGGDLSDQRGITGEAIATILDAIVTVG